MTSGYQKECKSIKLIASKKNYWSHLWPLSISMIAICAVFPLLFLQVEGRSVEAILLTIAILFCLFCLPEVIVFIRYYSLSKMSSIMFQDESLLYVYGEVMVKAAYHDIELVELHLSSSVYYERPRVIPTDNFIYARIILITGEELIVTSLLDLELFKTEWILSNQVHVIKVKHFVCWPSEPKIKSA